MWFRTGYFFSLKNAMTYGFCEAFNCRIWNSNSAGTFFDVAQIFMWIEVMTSFFLLFPFLGWPPKGFTFLLDQKSNKKIKAWNWYRLSSSKLLLRQRKHPMKNRAGRAALYRIILMVVQNFQRAILLSVPMTNSMAHIAGIKFSCLIPSLPEKVSVGGWGISAKLSTGYSSIRSYAE